MPTQYECRACDLRLFLGGYHGGPADDLWIIGVYCRHCGEPHCIEQPLQAAFPAAGQHANQPTKMTLSGPKGGQELVPDPGGNTWTVTCQGCGASGAMGSSGPLTDDPPGETAPDRPLTPEQAWAALGNAGAASFGPRTVMCPRCKAASLQYLGEFLT